MQRRKTGLVLAVVLVLSAGACTRAGEPTAPDAAARRDELTPPPAGPGAGTANDSTDRWGGYIGGGG